MAAARGTSWPACSPASCSCSASSARPRPCTPRPAWWPRRSASRRRARTPARARRVSDGALCACRAAARRGGGGADGEPRLQLGARHVGQPHGAAETLVLLRVVVLQANLQLDGLREAALLLLEKQPASRPHEGLATAGARACADLSSCAMPSRSVSLCSLLCVAACKYDVRSARRATASEKQAAARTSCCLSA